MIVKKDKAKRISKNIIVTSKIAIPSIILLAGPCRSGTSIHLQIFSNSNIASYNNPIKTLIQQALAGKKTEFKIPSNEKTIFIKESIGAITQKESSYNPVELLLEAGVPQSGIKVIINIRDPLPTYISWGKKYGSKCSSTELLNNFISAYNTTFNIYTYAKKSGVNTTVFNYELFKDTNPEVAIEKLLSDVNVNVQKNTTKNWVPPDSPRSKIHFMKTNPLLSGEDRTDKFNNTSEIKYSDTADSDIKILQKDRNVVIALEKNVSPVYQELCEEVS